MSETKTEAGEEPSIEEILESIRQIISDDDEEEEEEESSEPVAPEVDLAPKEEVADKEVEVDLAPKEEAADKEVEVDLAPKEEAADKEVEVDLAPKEETSVDDDSVLDLTEVVNADNKEEDKAMDKSSIDNMFDSEEPSKVSEPEGAALDIVDDEPTEDIISATTADAATVALAKLLSANVAIEREYDSRVGKVTLEDMTMEVMKPLIKVWLDQNLPDIIERLVKKEVEKLSRRALDR